MVSTRLEFERAFRLCRGIVDPLIVPGGDLRLASLFSSRMPGDDHPALHSTHVQLVSVKNQAPPGDTDQNGAAGAFCTGI